MAEITLVIPDGQLQRAVDALCEAGGWTADDNVSKPQFAKEMVANYVRESVRAVERSRAEATALATVEEVEPVTVE